MAYLNDLIVVVNEFGVLGQHDECGGINERSIANSDAFTHVVNTSL